MDPQQATYLSESIDFVIQGVPGLLAEVVLVLGIVIGLILAVLSQRIRNILPWFTGVTLIASLIAVFSQVGASVESGWLVSDEMARWFQALSILVSLLLIYPFSQDLRLHSEPNQRKGEQYLLILSTLLGVFLLLRANQFILAYLGMELISISSYILVSYTRKETRTAEAGVKFFLYGATASGLFLYGVSWLYGLGGSLEFLDPEFTTSIEESGLWVLPSCFVLAGLLFKLGSFPLHAWMPDAWEGSTYPVNTFLSILPKTAALIFLIRWTEVLIPLSGFETYRWILVVLSIASMTWGNLAALRQIHMRRLLAYSGVAHAGFLLMAVAIATPQSFRAAMFYLTMYAVMNLAIFLMADGFHRGMGHARWQEWEGRGRLFPWATASLAIILASLTGLPPSGGFIAKWLLFISALEYSSPLMITLVIAGALNTVLALAYYMIIPSRMVFRPTPEGDKAANQFPAYEWVMGMILGIILLISGIWGFDQLLGVFSAWF